MRNSLFRGGRLKQFMREWMSVTCDNEIWNAINGYRIKLTHLPWQVSKPKPIIFTAREETLISTKIAKLLTKRVIEKKTEYEPNAFVSKSLSEQRNMGLYIG